MATARIPLTVDAAPPPTPVRGASFGGYAVRVLIALALVAAALALWKSAQVLVITFGAVLFAIALRALADLLARHTPLPRQMSVPAAVLIVVIALGGGVWLVGDTLATQLAQLSRELPAAFAKLRDWLSRTDAGRAALGSLGSVDMESASKILGAAVGTLGAVGNALLILVLGIYLAADPGLYRRGLMQLVPDALRGRTAAALDDADRTLRRWLGGQVVAMVAVGLLTFVGLWALEVPLALSLATIAGLLEFIPFAGPILATVPALLIAFTMSPDVALYVAVLYFGVQQVEGYLLMPLVQRWAVSLPPALAVLAVVLFGVLLGIPGIIFAMPLAVVLMVLVRKFYLERSTPDA